MDFVEMCYSGDVRDLEKVNLLEIEKSEFESGFYTACFWGRPNIVKILLPFIDTVSCKCLQIACETLESNYSSDNRFLKTIELLLNSGKCVDVDTIHINVDDESTYFKTKVHALLDEYMFRLDGKIYNENILTY